VVKADAASNLRLYPFVVEPGAKLVASCDEDTAEVTKADGRVTLALRDSAKIANAGRAPRRPRGARGPDVDPAARPIRLPTFDGHRAARRLTKARGFLPRQIHPFFGLRSDH